MTLTVKERVFDEATQLQQRLKAAQEAFSNLRPAEQLSNSMQLQDVYATITDLQKKTQATYRRQADAIPEISNEELLRLSAKLTASTEILESIEKNNEVAVKYEEIASEVESLHNATVTLNATQLKSLQDRIRSLISSNPFLNRGNREAVETLQSAVLAMQGPSVLPTIPPAQTTQHDENRQLQAAQDEDYQASLFTDRFRELSISGCNGDPIKDFEKTLAFYIDVKKYALSKSSFASKTAGQEIGKILVTTEDLLNAIRKVQADIENQEVQVNQEQNVQTGVLKDLHAKIQQVLTASQAGVGPALSHVDKTFQKLEHDEKMKVFDALNALLKEQKTIQKDLGVGLRKVSINHWSGSWAQRGEAVERVLKAVETVAPATVVKKADEMRRRIDDAKNLQLAAPATPAKANQPVSSTLGMNRDNLYPNLAPIRSLQSLLPLLQVNSTYVQLQQACELLQILDSEGHHASFRMSEEKPRSIADRPRFHLYSIHKNETSKVNDEFNYGYKAFAGEIIASNDERLRSVQRTIVELVLESLELPINLEDATTVKNLLDLLENEKMKLDVKDRVREQHSVAYNLFIAFYHLHRSAHAHNSSLINPDDGQFGGDFGRVGFIKSMAGIDPAIKLIAINQVRNELKAVWKIV